MTRKCNVNPAAQALFQTLKYHKVSASIELIRKNYQYCVHKSAREMGYDIDSSIHVEEGEDYNAKHIKFLLTESLNEDVREKVIILKVNFVIL